MESEVDKNLSEALEIVPHETIQGELVVAEEHSVVVAEEPEEPVVDRDVAYDYEFSRNTHRDLIEQGQEALSDLLKVAKEGQHPRAYEVAANMLKSLSDMTDKLMILQEKKKALEGGNAKNSQPQVKVDKAVFVGSTADLLKQINKQ